MFSVNLNYYILGEAVSCFLSLVLCINIITSFTPSERRQRLFLYGAVACFIAALFNIFAVFCISYYEKLSIILCTFISSVYFLFLVINPLILSDYAIDVSFSVREKTKKVFFCITGTIYTVYVIILLLNIPFGMIFKYDYDLGYVRGPLKNITYVLTALYSIITFISVAINRKSMAKRLFWIFIIYPFLSVFVMSVQFLNNKIIMTGTASFCTLLLAYVSIQSDMIEFNVITGLRTENKLQKFIQLKNTKGVLYVVHIENKALLQNIIELSELNDIFLNFGKEMFKIFDRKAYHISDNRFAGICNTLDEAKKLDKVVKQYITKLNSEIIMQYGIPMEIYYAAIEFSEGNKSYNGINEIMNSLLMRAKRELSKELHICDEFVLQDMERKKQIYKILQKELRLNSSQLQVYFQPIYSIKDNKFTYMEALARLMETELGDIPPQEFVGVAESKGLIEKLGFVIFEKICKFVSENSDTIEAVSVNFSVYQMTNPNIVGSILHTIKRFGLQSSQIIMEITESIFIENFELVKKNMIELANAGIKFYLDDFGTGYSNLANVIRLPFSTIKIDRSLVLMMQENESNYEFFKNLIVTFKNAGFKILVEGVENEIQYELVKNVGVDYVQGFYFSRPVDGNKTIEFIKKSN